MTEDDYGTFDRAFRRLSGAFRIKLKPQQHDELARIYFKAFEDARLADVLAAGKTCLTTCRKFPTVAEWLDALPTAVTTVADCRVMTVDEAVAYHRAEGLHYEDLPCDCLLCQAAGVTAYALRFVPDVLEDGKTLARAFDTARNRVVVTGHWAHGVELQRWYLAREHFFTSVPRRFVQVLAHLVPATELVGAAAGVPHEREPGADDA